MFVKMDQKCSKFHLASDFTVISGSVDSTKSLANGLKHVIENHKVDKISI